MNRIYILPKMIVLTLLVTLLTKETRLWLIALYAVASFVLVIVYILLKLAVVGKWYMSRVNKGKPVGQEIISRYVNQYADLAIRLMRTEVKVTGFKDFDQSKTYFITPNHQSNMDILVVFDALKLPVLFVAKSSLMKVPGINNWMRLMDCTFLEKNNMRAQVQMMRDTVEKLQQGKNVVLFPEGKRSHGHEMNEFKAGAFKMALKTEAQILPVTLNHAYHVKNNFPFKRSIIPVHIHEPIPYEDYKDLNTNEIAEKVKHIITSKITE